MCSRIGECFISPFTYTEKRFSAYIQNASTSRKITDLVISIIAGIAVTALIIAKSAPVGIAVIANAAIIAVGSSLTFMFIMTVVGGAYYLLHSPFE